jgi:hypothetical protein
MSIDQQQSYQPQQPYGHVPAPVPPARPTNGIAVAGLILDFIVPPIGFILSLIGLMQSGRKGRRGLAVTGVILGLVFSLGLAGVVYAVVKVGDNVATVLDPGCLSAKTVMAANTAKLSNPATVKEALQSTIDGLAAAESKAQHDNVRGAVKTMKDDFIQLQQAVNGGTAPTGLDTKLATDGAAFDKICDTGAK